jgi:hypothetical protein
MQFTSMSDDPAIEPQHRAPAGVPGRLCPGEHLQLGTARPSSDLGGRDRIRPEHRARGTPPTAGLSGAAQQRSDVTRLVGQEFVQFREFRVGGPLGDRWSGRVRTTEAGREGRRPVRTAPGRPYPRQVAAGIRDESWQQRGAQIRLLIVERIGEPHEPVAIVAPIAAASSSPTNG